MAAALELGSHYGKALPSLEVEGASERFESRKPRCCRVAAGNGCSMPTWDLSPASALGWTLRMGHT